MLQELLHLELHKYILIFLRLGSAIMLMPGFMTTYINMRYRLSIALGLTIILYPFLYDKLPPAPQDFLENVKIYIFEITIGVFLGLMMQFTFTALNLAGNFAGTAIGYGCHGMLSRRSRIATIPIGYADGFNRKLGRGVGEVYVNGKRVPTVGNICMDLFMADVTDVDCKVGDKVEIFGEHITAVEIADKLGTIPYEVLTSVSERVKRVYYRE